MLNIFSRTELLVGKDGLNKLKNSKVAVIGLGGVGSFVAEGLTRAGIGNLILIDNDTISETNINRQIHATTKTINLSKVEVMKKRILEINPQTNVTTYMEFLTDKNMNKLILKNYDYIVDAIDTISSKINLIITAKKNNIPIISSMGTANKLNPTEFEVVDIKRTIMCPVAKIIRKELKKTNINSLKVIYSKEKPIKTNSINTNMPLGSISFVPSVAGLIIASEVVKDIIKKTN